MDDAVALIVSGGLRGGVHLCNAFTLSLACRDHDLAAALASGAANLPDGMPLVWIARRLGLKHMDDRVYGPVLMERVLDRGRTLGVRHYLYGSTESTLVALRNRIDERWPGAELVGWEAPPFSDDPADFESSVQRIVEARPDVVWVGLGTPKQDFVVDRFAWQADATVVAIGAAFDFIAETKRRAPAWVGRIGMEWAFRLVSEPRRLWKRYTFGSARFIAQNVRCHPHVIPAGVPSPSTGLGGVHPGEPSSCK